MHRVAEAHLKDFVDRFDVRGDQAKQFEAFTNYSIFRSISADTVDPNSLVYDGDDPGIDGFMVFIDDTYVSSSDEVEEALKGRKRDSDVLVVFTQSKTGEAWKKSDITLFHSGVVDFLSDEHAYPHAEYLENSREIFETVLKKVGKIKGGKPRVSIQMVTTARPTNDREIVAARNSMSTAVNDTGLFSEIVAELVDRDQIISLWKSSDGHVEAELKLLGNAPFPKAPGIVESYVVTVRAKDFIESILTDQNGKLRKQIFEENVRDFIGIDGDVNSEMVSTLEDPDKQERFGILNNGITIISPDVRVSGFEMYLSDFQIVNGCQTSNVLFENRHQVKEDATLVLKVVETSEPSVVDDIVRSTNRQTKVDESQFLATLDAIKTIERYFDARAQEDDYRLFFERRTDQFSTHEDAKAIRVFDIKEIARCSSAMFLDRPDIASRYPNRLTSELRDLVFDNSYREEIYYVSAYALYRVKILIANRKIDGRFMKLRWHILMAIKYYVCGDRLPALSSSKIDNYADNIYSFLSVNSEERVAEISSLCNAIVDIDEVTRDRVKGSALALEVKTRALAIRREKGKKR